MMFSFIQFLSIILLLIYKLYLNDSLILIIFNLSYSRKFFIKFFNNNFNINSYLFTFIVQFGENQILIHMNWYVKACEINGNIVFPFDDNSTILLIVNM